MQDKTIFTMDRNDYPQSLPPKEEAIKGRNNRGTQSLFDNNRDPSLTRELKITLQPRWP